MILEEFLIKIGVDASKASEISKVIHLLQNGVNRLSDSSREIKNNTDRAIKETNKSVKEAGKATNETQSKVSKLKLGLLALISVAVLSGKKMWGAFNEVIDKAKELALRKDALFNISKKELIQAEQYQREMSRVGVAFDSIKTKIALNLAPAVTDLISGFRNWLTVNKELIAGGITKIIKMIGNIIQVFINYYEFMNLIITNTIGWKNAIIALIAVWAVFNSAFLLSPVGLVIGAITVLLLLIDDLMVYMKGGKSLFGSYWQPLIDGAKALWEHINLSFQFIKALWRGDSEAIKSISKKVISSVMKALKAIINGIKTVLSSLLKNILVFFGMSESKASKTVDRIGKIFSFIFDVITLPFRKSYEGICNIMDMLGLDVGDVINGICFALRAIWAAIIAPFQAAWEFVNSLFDIWEDDTKTITDKIGDTFKAIFTFITSPFTESWQHVKEEFELWGKDVETFIEGVGETFSELFDPFISPFRDGINWIENSFSDLTKKFKSKFKKYFSWTGFFDDDKDEKQIKPNSIEPTNSLNTNTAKAAMGRVSSKVNNNAVTINNTMNVTTPQEGFDNLNNLAKNEIQNVADNAQTALGAN